MKRERKKIECMKKLLMPREMKWRNHEGSQLPWLYFFISLLLAHIQNSRMGVNFLQMNAARDVVLLEREEWWNFHEKCTNVSEPPKNKHRHRARAAANFLLHNNDELLTPSLVDPTNSHSERVLTQKAISSTTAQWSAQERWVPRAQRHEVKQARKKKVDQSRKPNVGQKFERN